MPWNVTATQMQWTGVKFDRSKTQHFCKASEDLQTKISAELTQYGINNPGSPQQIVTFLQANGFADHFPKTKSGSISTSDRNLVENMHLHSVIPLIRSFEKFEHLPKIRQ